MALFQKTVNYILQELTLSPTLTYSNVCCQNAQMPFSRYFSPFNYNIFYVFQIWFNHGYCYYVWKCANQKRISYLVLIRKKQFNLQAPQFLYPNFLTLHIIKLLTSLSCTDNSMFFPGKSFLVNSSTMINAEENISFRKFILCWSVQILENTIYRCFLRSYKPLGV